MAEDLTARDVSSMEWAQNDWSELCEQVDCTAFPDGYVTMDLAEERYYFPLRATMGLPQHLGNAHNAGLVSQGPGGEFNQEGLLVRSYKSAAVIHFYDRFPMLVSWFNGVDFELPRLVGGFVSASAYPANLIDSLDSVMEARTVPGYPEEPDGFADKNLLSLSKSFNMVLDVVDDDPNWLYQRRAIVSSGPILAGNWIVGQCVGASCKLTVWPTAQNRQDNDIMFVIKHYNAIFDFEAKCAGDLDSNHRNCTETRQALDLIPVVFEKLFEMMDAARIHPGSASKEK